jgi:hypothetical protein
MPVPSVVATPGVADANSYLTRAEATTYHDAHLYASKWTSASNDQKDIAIIMATRVLDAMVEWTGVKATEAQKLQWPRSGMRDRSDDYALADTVIPQELKDAVAELARTLLAADRTLDSDLETLGITALKAGSVALDFTNPQAKVIADAVAFLLPVQWGTIRSRRSGNVPVLRA